jgi:predicted RecA/RadA family phage recombinase
MGAEATLILSALEEVQIVSAAAYASGEVIQLADGRAGVVQGLNNSSGDPVDVLTLGAVELLKTASIVILEGGRVYWDHSANKAHYKKVNDRDFYVGRAVSDSASTDTTVKVQLNVNPPDDLDLNRDPVNTVLVGTPAALAVSFNYPRRLGGANLMYLSATSEAQKVDMITTDGFAKGAKAIVEFGFRVPVGGSGGASDYSIGVANATHASDADSIADSVFIHLDGGSTNIYAESDDGTTEVAATDTTVDFTAGITFAERVEVWMDFRDPADVQIYVNGALVLGSTVFNVDAYAGPWYLLVHLEKSTGTETADLALDFGRARFAQQRG